MVGTFTWPPGARIQFWCLQAAVDDPRTYGIIGAAMLVHRELGPGYVEKAYQRAMELALADAGIAFQSQVALGLHFLGRPLGVPFRADMVCRQVVLEFKALPTVGSRERRQLAHYLKATGMPLGLLLNFGSDSLHVERVTNHGVGSKPPGTAFLGQVPRIAFKSP